MLKIDVEGAEWEALGCVSADILDRIEILLGEWHAPAGIRELEEGVDYRSRLLNSLKRPFRDISRDLSMAANDFAFVNK